MLLIVLALFWVALLTPTVIRRFRDHGTERSIESFHTEHEVLSRQEYVVPPVHRLDTRDVAAPVPAANARKSRLTVVHADDTYRSLESRGSWDEWSQDYEYYDEDAAPARPQASNRYASAYSSVPQANDVRETYQAPIRRRSMKSRRRVMFTRVVALAVVTSVAAYFVGNSILVDVAVLTWIAVIGFVALALYAVSQGYLNESSLPLRLPRRQHLATVQPLYDEYPVADDYDSEYYESDDDLQWQRQSQPRRAFG